MEKTLVAGPELDARIEIEVFGNPAFSFAKGAYWQRATGIFRPRPFSTDIASAFLLVEEVRRRGCWFKLHYGFEGKQYAFAAFDQQNWADPNPLWQGRGETVPLAICEAALAAIKGLAELPEVEEG